MQARRMTDSAATEDKTGRARRRRRHVRRIADIVLGVLIALGLGAAATEIGWRVEVAGAREALAIELGEIVGQADERLRTLPCIERRLDQLAGIIDADAAAGQLPPIGAIGNPPLRSWSRGVWDSIINAQTAAHFDREALDNLSGAYEFLELIRRASLREPEVWTTIHQLVGPGRALAPGEAAQLRGAIGEARMLARQQALYGLRIQQLLVAQELGWDEESATPYRQRAVAADPICGALGAVPPRYGQAVLEGAVEAAYGNPITRENPGVPVAPRR